MAQIDDLRGLRRGHVAFGTLLTLAEDLVPNVLSTLRSNYGDVSYSHYAGNSEDIVRQIVDGILDIGLCWNPPSSAPLSRAKIFDIQPGILVAPAHPLSIRRAVALKDCLQYPFIFPSRGSEIRNLLDRINVGIGVTVSPVIETNSIQLAKRMAAAGHGIAVLSALSAAGEINDGKLVHVPLIDEGMQQIQLALLYQKGRILPPVVQMVMTHLESNITDYIKSTTQSTVQRSSAE